MKDPEDHPMNCDECGEFECDIDHQENEYQDDGDWMFDGSGMVGDD